MLANFFDEFFKVAGPLFFSAIAAVTFLLIAGAVGEIFWKFVLGRDPIPVSHKIAVIGLPGSGKTTLITALFELIQKGVHTGNVRLHGLKTIEIVNKNVAHLTAGQKVGPTTEKDIFVFRFSYTKRKRFISKLYDVEIADFPGEYSDRISMSEIANPSEISSAGTKSRKTKKQKLIPSFEYTLFNREFFSWIASSREYLFLVDLSSVYSAESIRAAVAEIISRIRASWQVIEDSTSERGLGSVRGKSVHIVFTKADSLLSAYRADFSLKALYDSGSEKDPSRQVKIANAKKKIKSVGQITDLSGQPAENQKALDAIKNENDRVFSDLIEFFESRSKSVTTIYASAALMDASRNRIGFKQILQAVLP